MAGEYKGACSSTIVGIPKDANSSLLRTRYIFMIPRGRRIVAYLLYGSVNLFRYAWQPLIVSSRTKIKFEIKSASNLFRDSDIANDLFTKLEIRWISCNLQFYLIYIPFSISFREIFLISLKNRNRMIRSCKNRCRSPLSLRNKLTT